MSARTAAVIFSVDDVHPATSAHRYEAGGDLGTGALGRLAELIRRHPRLKTSLCVTPDWRLDSLVPDRPLLSRIPILERRVHWTRRHRRGLFRLDRHPRFVSFLNDLERCEVVPHGLTHSHAGPEFAVEFQHQSEATCLRMVQRGLEIFQAAGLRHVRGYVPPAWNAPPSLIRALDRLEFKFLSSARDLQTPVTRDASTAMSGLKGMSLIYPQIIGERGLVHLTCNFQATSAVSRAIEILELEGVLHIKAHIFKSGGGHTMLDGLDDAYAGALDRLFTLLDRRFGSRLWWAHLSEVAERATA